MKIVPALSYHAYRRSIFVVLLVMIGMLTEQSCTKIDDKPALPFEPQPPVYFITELIDTAWYVGMAINDPYNKRQYAAFGPKDETGKMDTIYNIVERLPENDGWLAHEFNEDFQPTATHTSTGHTIEFKNVNKGSKTGTVVIKESATGTILWQKDALPFPDEYWDNQDAGEKLAKSGKGRVRNKTAEMVYVGTQMASCVIGIASFTVGGPIATMLSIYKTVESCKSAAKSVQNIYNNQPAFGCATTKTHAKAFQNAGKGVLSVGKGLSAMLKTLPAAIGYLAQSAGQEGCNDKEDPADKPLPELPPRDIGSIWGDPHMSTLDGFLYDFHGFGEFIAAKSLADNFEVQVRLGNPYINNPQTTYNIGIGISTGNDNVSFLAGPNRLYINGIARALDFNSLPLQNGAMISRSGSGSKEELIVKHQHGDLVKIQLLGANYFDFAVQLTEDRKGKMEGLLGNYDGVKTNDLRLRNGELVAKTFADMYPKFADNWRIKNEQSLFYYAAGTNTSSFTRTDLPKSEVSITYDKYETAEATCISAGLRSEPYLSACIVDVATSGNPAAAASSLAQQERDSLPQFPALNMTAIQMKGDAAFLNNNIRLTRNTSYVAGQAFQKQALHGDFETNCVFRMGLSKNGGADGLALLISKDIPLTVSNAYPGKSGKLGYEGVASSLAIEFDTNIDGLESSNHIAIHTNGTGANSTDNNFRIAYNPNIVPLEDGMFHNVRVRYQGNKLMIWLDDLLVLEKAVNLKQSLGLTDNFYLGLTASTSSSSQAHFIHSWETKNL